MALITIETKINIDDYVTEISDKELIREIKRRVKISGKTLEEFVGKEANKLILSPREEEFERFNKWIDQNTPNIRKIRNQITFEEYIRLTEKYNGEQIRTILTSIGNYKDAPKKYVSVNLTLQKWMKKEYG